MVEGASILQGGCKRILNGQKSSFYKLLIAILLVTIFAGKGQARLFDKNNHTYNQNESEKLSRRIRQAVCELEYSENIAEDFAAMFNGRQNKNSNPFLADQRQKLHQIREYYSQGGIKLANVAEVEQNIAEDIAFWIEYKIDYAEEDFELSDVIKNKQANCLGFTQLFYVLCNSVGLSVIPINVVELQSTGPLPTGTAHMACMVDLSDGRTIMLNLVPGGFVSEPFVTEEKFTKFGNYLKLIDKYNPLEIFRRIQPLDRDGLIAYIYINRGYVNASGGQFEQAITNYSRAIELNPNSAEAYNNRGIAYRNLDKLQQSVADYTKAVELNPNYAEAYNNRGIAYSKLGQLYLAICDYNESIELNPQFAEAYNNRANAYTKLGQLERAISDYTKAIKNNSYLAKAYGNRAVTYALLGEKKTARKDLLKAIKLNPDLKMHAKNLSELHDLGLAID